MFYYGNNEIYVRGWDLCYKGDWVLYILCYKCSMVYENDKCRNGKKWNCERWGLCCKGNCFSFYIFYCDNNEIYEKGWGLCYKGFC